MWVRDDVKDNDPTKANNIWGKFREKNDDTLGKEDVTSRSRRFFTKVIKNQLKFLGKSHFVSKCPGWKEFLELPMAESSGLEWKKTIELIRKSATILPEEYPIKVGHEDFMRKSVCTKRKETI
jgi:hypothetical protein